MSSSCFGSLDIRSPGVFTETFLDHYHLDICKSNAKTHKIISINRFGITCCYFSSRNIPAIALFAATFLSNLVLSRSNQCFGCGLDQSHCRKLHIQIWLWPGLFMASVYNYCINYAIDLLACMLVLCAQENYFFQMSSNARREGGGGGGVSCMIPGIIHGGGCALYL